MKKTIHSYSFKILTIYIFVLIWIINCVGLIGISFGRNDSISNENIILILSLILTTEIFSYLAIWVIADNVLNKYIKLNIDNLTKKEFKRIKRKILTTKNYKKYLNKHNISFSNLN
ncbi:hypothetical protein [Mycoplasma sp. CSL7503-lung]|uniref:hypothetical protein n=1 Tax=Mycoplasma sp. CSL7503-lung TaxID=536372 RepID=UPI0021CF2C05|nr:hypothetical protein [Mycoplasma sp. CSL7503-lung]MCU4706437.1 hypothetical protein [Mycoplasma sp. CSL7503-lung]